MANKHRTHFLRLVSDERTCLRIADALGERLDNDDTAVATFELDGGGWAVEAYFNGTIDPLVVENAVKSVVDDGPMLKIMFGEVAQRDWVANSLANLTPVTAGRFVVHGSHARAQVRPNQIGIKIEAALAFGTGHHGTTRGCLLALDAWLRNAASPHSARILDIGTGSGVLAIAAAKALRVPILASDNDPQAVRVARDNARTNGARAYVEFVHAAGIGRHRFRQRAPYDLVFANILLGPLKGLARPIASVLVPQGRAVLSGLLPSQANAIVATYRAQGLHLERRRDLAGWTTLVMMRARRPVAARRRRT